MRLSTDSAYIKVLLAGKRSASAGSMPSPVLTSHSAPIGFLRSDKGKMPELLSRLQKEDCSAAVLKVMSFTPVQLLTTVTPLLAQPSPG